MLLSDPVHFTRLRYMARSPAHYASAVVEPREPSYAMRVGSNVDAVLFRRDFVVWDGRRQGAKWEEFEDAHDGALIMTTTEHDLAMRCCDAIGANREATRVLVGEHQVTLNWTTLGRSCEGTPDVVGSDYVTELKTCSNAEPAQFQRGAMRLGYHSQIPWYSDALRRPHDDGFIVAVETAPPFAVSVFALTPRCLEAGRKLYRLWMERLLNCEASNEWPAYCQSIVPFDVPDMSEPLIIDGEEVDAA